LKAERYVANAAKDLAPYGLAKPYLRVAVKPEPRKEKDKDKEAGKDEGKERVLLIGKESTEKDKKGRYARLGDSEAVFVLGEKVVAAVDHAALDLLDRKLLTLDQADVQEVKGTGDKGSYTLKREKEEWRVVGSPAPPFAADKDAALDTLRTWSDLKAK